MTANATPYVIQALSHPADNFRRALSFVAWGQQGVRSWVNGDLAVTANGTPNMSVNVAAGQLLVAGTQNTVSQGSYHGLNDATVNLTIAAADPTNPRIDIVVAQVEDAAYSGANNDFKLPVVTGTPAPSPSPPATPNNAIVLAQVAVAANATSITSGNITDKRVFMGSQFKALGYRNVAQNVGPGFTTVQLDTKVFDPNGNLDVVTNHQYTAPVAGYYQISGQVQANGLGTNAWMQAAIGVNSTPAYGGSVTQISSGPTDGGSVISVVAHLNANDTVQLMAQGSGAFNTRTGSSADYLSIHYLSS